MTPTENVEAEIRRFLASPTPEVLCVTGDWGVGKTFLWQALLDQATQKQNLGLNRYAYASLFGVSSLESLKVSIFENTSFLVSSASSGIGAGTKRGINTAVKAVGKFGATAAELAGLGDAFSKAGPLFFATVRDQIVCVDDMERRSVGLSV